MQPRPPSEMVALGTQMLVARVHACIHALPPHALVSWSQQVLLRACKHPYVHSPFAPPPTLTCAHAAAAATTTVGVSDGGSIVALIDNRAREVGNAGEGLRAAAGDERGLPQLVLLVCAACCVGACTQGQVAGSQGGGAVSKAPWRGLHNEGLHHAHTQHLHLPLQPTQHPTHATPPRAHHGLQVGFAAFCPTTLTLTLTQYIESGSSAAATTSMLLKLHDAQEVRCAPELPGPPAGQRGVPSPTPP